MYKITNAIYIYINNKKMQHTYIKYKIKKKKKTNAT